MCARVIGVIALLAGCGRIGFRTSDGSRGDGASDHDGVAITANIAFVSSVSSVPGQLGGAAGADAICTQRATAAGLPGHYAAWISTSTSNAIDRLGSARGWVRIDGLPIIDQASELATHIWYAIDRDETGARPVSHVVVTATTPQGQLDTSAGTCFDFSRTNDPMLASSGYSDATDASFTSSGQTACNTGARIYCFGADRSDPVTLAPATGRFAFVSQAAWAPGSGFASADALCQTEASAAALPGTYLALLASRTASAASRFSLTGPTWVRIDGVRLAATPDDFMAGTLDAPLSVAANGATLPAALVWTGYFNPTDVGTSIGSETCNDWTVSSGGAFGGRGSSARASTDLWTHQASAACSTASQLFCLQQ